MRNIFITFTVLFMFVSIYVTAQSYSEFPMELISRIPNGRGEGQLKYEIQPGSGNMSGPNSLFFNGEIPVVADTLNARFVELDSQFNWSRALSTGGIAPHGFFRETHEDNWVSLGNNVSMGFAFNQEQLFMVGGRNDDPYLVPTLRDVVYHNEILFIRNGDGDLVHIPNPQISTRSNQEIVQGTDQTRVLFDSDSDWDPQGLTIDENDRLFLNGELATLDYQTFYEYWEEYHAGDIEKLTDIGMRISTNATMRYMGRDSDGNHYWAHYHIGVAIFSPEGKLFYRLRYNDSNVSTIPAVSPEGD
ncbi:MAG: hypothetical protein ACOC0D_05735, partial [Spirochaeta sp.]